MSDQTVTEQIEESLKTEPSFQMGLTPLGKIGINITDSNGTSAGYIINTPTEAWEIAGHLLAIATMMVQTYYAVAQQEQDMMAKILAEHSGPQKVWTPGDK
jgi:hypothetical protein